MGLQSINIGISHTLLYTVAMPFLEEPWLHWVCYKIKIKKRLGKLRGLGVCNSQLEAIAYNGDTQFENKLNFKFSKVAMALNFIGLFIKFCV